MSISTRLQTKLKLLSLTGFSFGIATDSVSDIQEVIALADSLIYQQKQKKAELIDF